LSVIDHAAETALDRSVGASSEQQIIEFTSVAGTYVSMRCCCRAARESAFGQGVSVQPNEP
jgi:hypothetical protein